MCRLIDFFPFSFRRKGTPLATVPNPSKAILTVMFVSSKFSIIAIITEFCENSYHSNSLFQYRKEKTNQTIRSSYNLEIAFQK